jgi:hypothetical protein
MARFAGRKAAINMKNRLVRIVVITLALINISMASIFLFHEFFNFTSSNSALYFMRGQFGGVEIKRDLLMEDADRLIFMLDANRLFNYFMKGMAVAKNRPILELTWDKDVGVGHIKQFRTDGTILMFPFSRFTHNGFRPQGLFLGGDLPYGDTVRSEDRNTVGLSYYDGKKWYHIWCATNEGFGVQGGTLQSVYPMHWQFLRSKVLKNTPDEIILQSEHRLKHQDHVIDMKRLASFTAGDNFFTLKVMFKNSGLKPLIHGYSWGDEPWVGEFGTSNGDVGWYKDGLITNERLISPNRYRYVGLWDYGNEAAGEGHNYSGHANFVEWGTPLPSFVFLSNSIDKCCDVNKPLASEKDRTVSIVWHDQLLMPGQSRIYTLVIGMASVDPETNMPVKPVTALN